jgi:hypothetical protein
MGQFRPVRATKDFVFRLEACFNSKNEILRIAQNDIIRW